MDFPITIERERVLTNNKRDQGFGKYFFYSKIRILYTDYTYNNQSKMSTCSELIFFKFSISIVIVAMIPRLGIAHFSKIQAV